MRNPFLYFALILAILIFMADQYTKNTVIDLLKAESQTKTITPFLDLVLVLNKGVSFGMFNNNAENTPAILMGISGGIILALLIWLFRTHILLNAIALGLVIGGALGNLYDRAKYGGVVDFISFHIGPYAWPAFNVADSAIVIGVGLLLLQSLVFDKKGRVS